ncbi:TerD family protein [Kitasatospora paranensis]|uniref:TerD family protein n=1 Tax=Kitasatospora paranensis TaxID=258053 RepID=A0ABW2FZS8_9ACTN
MTHVMAKGANIPLTAAAVRAVLRWTAAPGAPEVDVSALLVAAGGKVRSDADFVFYNQPEHPSGAVRHRPGRPAGGGEEVSDEVEVDLARLPGDVDRVVLAGSAEGGSFRAVPGLRLLVFDAAVAGSAALAEFPVTDGDEVSALVAGEFYRRDGGWKFRAVGQGYATGLSGLATDYGIAIEDGDEPAADAAPAPAPAPVDEEPDIYSLAPAPPAAPLPPPPASPPTAPAPAAAPAAPAPQHAAPSGYGHPQPAAAQAGGYGYPQTPYPPQPQPGYGYPPPQQPNTGYGYPQQQPAPQPQPNTGYGYPQQQAPVPQPQPVAPQPGFALPPQGPQFQPR